MRNLTKHIFLILNSIAATALLLAYLSDVVNPATIWGFAFLGLAYPYLLLINIAFVIFWWWRKNKNAFISVIAILLGFGFLIRYVQFPAKKKLPKDQKSLNIVSYNVRIFNYYKWENKSSISDSLLEFIVDQKPGIACFQEFFTKKLDPKLSEQGIKQKLASLPYAHIEYSKVFNRGQSHFGIATFSKFPIINKGKILFGNSVNACIYSDILVDSDTFRIYNMHLQSIQLKKDNYTLMDSIFYLNSKKLDEVKDVTSRMKRAYIARSEQTLTIAEHMSNSPYPIIMCGDFNDTPASFTYKKLLGDKLDAYRESGSGLGKTYRGNLPSFRIDYIFYSPEFYSRKYQTHKVRYSDHYPISVSLIQNGK